MGQRTLLLVGLALVCSICTARAQVTASGSLLYYLTCDSLPAADSSSNARPNATAVGAPTVVTGKVGNAFRLNSGLTQTDAFYAGQWQVADPVSVTAWFQIDDAAANNFMKIVSTKSTFDDANGFEAQYNPADKVFTLLGSGDAPFATSNPVTVNANTWYHVAVVASGVTGAIYLNGVAVTGSAALSTAVKANPKKDVIVGGSATLTELNAGGVWHGVLDEVRVYGIALTGAQVQAIIAEAVTASTTTTATVTGTTTTSTATIATAATSATASTTTTTASATGTITTSAETSATTSATTSAATSATTSATTAVTTTISPLEDGAALFAPFAVLLVVLMLAVLVQ